MWKCDCGLSHAKLSEYLCCPCKNQLQPDEGTIIQYPEERYEILNGKFGPYFFDRYTEESLSLESVLKILNTKED